MYNVYRNSSVLPVDGRLLLTRDGRECQEFCVNAVIAFIESFGFRPPVPVQHVQASGWQTGEAPRASLGPYAIS
jgi:hypothetical protein